MIKTILLPAFGTIVFSLTFQNACAQNPPALQTPPVAGQPWTNSPGMKIVPAGTAGVLFSIWDVRVKDFQAYARATAFQQTGGISCRCFLQTVNTN